MSHYCFLLPPYSQPNVGNSLYNLSVGMTRFGRTLYNASTAGARL